MNDPYSHSLTELIPVRALFCSHFFSGAYKSCSLCFASRAFVKTGNKHGVFSRMFVAVEMNLEAHRKKIHESRPVLVEPCFARKPVD